MQFHVEFWPLKPFFSTPSNKREIVDVTGYYLLVHSVWNSKIKVGRSIKNIAISITINLQRNKTYSTYKHIKYSQVSLLRTSCCQRFLSNSNINCAFLSRLCIVLLFSSINQCRFFSIFYLESSSSVCC